MIAKMIYFIRQWRIARLERIISKLKRRQRAAWNRHMARSGIMATRTPVPEFLRRRAP